MANGPVLLSRWDDFRGGEYGRIGGDNCRQDQWTGRNCLVSKGGGIFKRPGWYDIGRLSATTWNSFEPMAVGFSENNGDQVIWTIRTDGATPTIARCPFPTGAGITSYTGTSPGTPSSSQRYDFVDDGDHKTYVAVYGGSIFELNHNTGASFKIVRGGAPHPDGGRAITIYGERMVVGGILGNLNRILFSRPNDYTSTTAWPTANFLDIGRTGDTIVALDTIRDSLIVSMSDGDIYIISGALGVNEVVRRFTPLGYAGANITANTIATTQRGLMWRLRRRPLDTNSAVAETWDDHHPQSFDGARVSDIDYLAGTWFTSTAYAGCVVAGEMLDDVTLMMGNGEFLTQRDGVWTKHALVGISGSGNVFGSRMRRSVGFGFAKASSTGKYVAIDLGLDHPVAARDESTFTASFTTARKHDRDGRLMSPRHVLIEYDGFQSGNLVVTLNYHSVWGAQADTTVATSITYANVATGGARVSKLFSFTPAYQCQSFSVTCEINGVRIENISVWGEVNPARIM